MASHVRLKLLVAALGLTATTIATAATEQHLQAQSLGVTPTNQLVTRLGLSADNAFVAKAALPTVRGTQTVRMQQTFKGVPVFGRDIAVEQDAQGNALVASGVVAQDLGVDLASVTPKITGAAALAVLQRQSRSLVAGSAPISNSKADLYVYPVEGGAARLVYLTSYVSGGDQPSRPTAIIDANTGEVIQQWEGLTTADYSATGPGGNQKVGQYTYTGTTGSHPYLAVTQSGTSCTASNANVKTYNLNQGTGAGTLYSFTCTAGSATGVTGSVSDAINGAYSPINDAHHFGGVVHDMYVSYMGAPPLNQVLLMKVHYSKNYENAYWDGTQMTFGDGASTFYPLVALDVTGHEISHGYTEQHSNLTYSGQSGGMNEAFSDMAGEAVKYFDRGTNDFLVGSDIFKGTGALRYMCNPTQDGASIDNAANYTSSLDVHYSSGVYNKAFCLLAKTSGWDTAKAFKAFARANAVYWTASSTFNSGACGVESAAVDLGYTKADVTAAFTGVGVSCSGGTGGSTALTNGTAVTGLSGSASQELNYTVVVPAGKTLVIKMSGGTGDADLYVKFGSAPTTSSYGCRPYLSGNAETCTFTGTSAGTYYIKVRGYSAFSGVSLLATW
ncbi:pseudolysin/vibriolysin [Luteibacter sp. Sphag1AF]|uniref:M4 family metallopeptidase n=1 Tax=Luteibacter sp. Sphag1AF TaxID=2587031 RepID=UPI00160E3EB3|nr:M4 family metallopeptidase [Luteibacter sp. Sphag1AF]MBB3225510.1 pseudolysin/vibriolysin [Luteibacter sp. Sphag1AF]